LKGPAVAPGFFLARTSTRPEYFQQMCEAVLLEMRLEQKDRAVLPIQ
jgi:hypothetical protein